LSIDFSKYDEPKKTTGKRHYINVDNPADWAVLTNFFNTESPSVMLKRLVGFIRDIENGTYKVIPAGS